MLCHFLKLSPRPLFLSWSVLLLGTLSTMESSLKDIGSFDLDQLIKPANAIRHAVDNCKSDKVPLCFASITIRSSISTVAGAFLQTGLASILCSPCNVGMTTLGRTILPLSGPRPRHYKPPQLLTWSITYELKVQ